MPARVASPDGRPSRPEHGAHWRSADSSHFIRAVKKQLCSTTGRRGQWPANWTLVGCTTSGRIASPSTVSRSPKMSVTLIAPPHPVPSSEMK